MGAAGTQGQNADGGRTTAPAPILLQLVASGAGTVVGEALGPTFGGKLVTGMVGAAAGAFLTAPGTQQRRRIVAVALFAALLAGFKRTDDARAAESRRGEGKAWQPANWAAVALTAVVGFAVGSGITTARGGWDDSSSNEVHVTVPEVRGEPRSDALRTLDDADLQPASSEEPSESIAEGFATRTDPQAGTPVDEGAAVRVFVSSGPPPAELRVPDVSGLPRADALLVLDDVGLRPILREAPSDSVAKGLVIGTDPPARTLVNRGAEVSLLISSGPSPANPTVPDVIADLSITKVDAPDPVGPGQLLTYTLDVGNGGPATSTNVRVSDNLPDGVTFRKAGASQGTCSDVGGTVTCELGQIAGLGGATVDITITTGEAGTLTNTARVAGAETDPDATNNAATTSTTVEAPSTTVETP